MEVGEGGPSVGFLAQRWRDAGGGGGGGGGRASKGQRRRHGHHRRTVHGVAAVARRRHGLHHVAHRLLAVAVLEDLYPSLSFSRLLLGFT